MAFSLMGQIGVPTAGGFFDDCDESEEKTDTTQMDMMGSMEAVKKTPAKVAPREYKGKSPFDDDETDSGGAVAETKSTTEAGAKAKDWWDEEDTELQKSDEIPETEDPSEHMAMFDEIKAMTAKIQANSERVFDLAQDVATVTQTSAETKILKTLNGIMADNSKVQLAAKSKIEELNAANDAFEKEKPASSIGQWRKNQLNACTRRFKEASAEFQSTMKQFHAELKSKQKRQITNYDVDNELSDRKIDEIVEDPVAANEFITKTVQMQDISDTMLERLEELEEQHKGMVKIQEGMKQLNEMWKELAVLITEQQELLDNISLNVEQTAHYVEQGVTQLHKAEGHQKASRKMKLWVTGCGCVILLIVVLSTLGGTGALGGS